MSLQVSDKLQGLRGDIFGGMTAAVVALPLSLAFGVASGIGAVEGLYSAVVVGMLAALLGGSKTQISGPTAPLSVAMAVVFVDYADGELSKALAIVAMAGILGVGIYGSRALLAVLIDNTDTVRAAQSIHEALLGDLSGRLMDMALIGVLMIVVGAAAGWVWRRFGPTPPEEKALAVSGGDFHPVPHGGGSPMLQRRRPLLSVSKVP